MSLVWRGSGGGTEAGKEGKGEQAVIREGEGEVADETMKVGLSEGGRIRSGSGSKESKRKWARKGRRWYVHLVEDITDVIGTDKKMRRGDRRGKLLLQGHFCLVNKNLNQNFKIQN